MPKKTTHSPRKKHAALGGKSLPTGKEIYDRLMSKIEPELMLSNLTKLDAPYKKETPAKRKKRYAGYSKAFKEYSQQYKTWLARVMKAVKAYKRAVVKASEKMLKVREDSALVDLEKQMKAA